MFVRLLACSILLLASALLVPQQANAASAGCTSRSINGYCVHNNTGGICRTASDPKGQPSCSISPAATHHNGCSRLNASCSGGTCQSRLVPGERGRYELYCLATATAPTTSTEGCTEQDAAARARCLIGNAPHRAAGVCFLETKNNTLKCNRSTHDSGCAKEGTSCGYGSPQKTCTAARIAGSSRYELKCR